LKISINIFLAEYGQKKLKKNIQYHGGTAAPPHDKITRSKTISRFLSIYKRLFTLHPRSFTIAA
jgi:hypothetical protein